MIKINKKDDMKMITMLESFLDTKWIKINEIGLDDNNTDVMKIYKSKDHSHICKYETNQMVTYVNSKKIDKFIEKTSIVNTVEQIFGIKLED